MPHERRKQELPVSLVPTTGKKKWLVSGVEDINFGFITPHRKRVNNLSSSRLPPQNAPTELLAENETHIYGCGGTINGTFNIVLGKAVTFVILLKGLLPSPLLL